MIEWEGIKKLPDSGEWVLREEAEQKIHDLEDQLGSCRTISSILTEISMKDTQLEGCKTKLKRVKKLLKEIHETVEGDIE